MELRENIENFNRLLIDDISSRLTGSNYDYITYYGDWPSDRFPAGNLKPSRRGGNQQRDDRESEASDVPQYMRSSYMPSSIGLAIYVKDIRPESKVKIKGQFMVFETLSPARQVLLEEVMSRYGNNPSGGMLVSFPKRFGRRMMSFEASFSPSSYTDGNFRVIDSISDKIDFRDAKDADNDTLHCAEEIPKEIAYGHFSSEEAYRQYIDAINTGPLPRWDYEIQTRIKKYQNYSRVDIYLVNRTSSYIKDQSKDPDSRWLWLFDPFFFEPQLSVQLVDAELASVPLPEITETDYRFSTQISATGRNCHAAVHPESRTVKTEVLPIYVQNKVNWIDSRIDSETLSYSVLGGEDPRPRLSKMAKAMHMYLDEWYSRAMDYRNNAVHRDDPSAWGQVEESREKFQKEIERFESGIKALDNDGLRLAFQLMNQSYYERSRFSERHNTKWRSFQLVFIVSLLPDILAREMENSVEITRAMPATILWLPTAAGKTEAFTGAILVQAFFDRIRGKNSGVSAILKFPLRFLSMQQLDRAVLSVGAANIVLNDNKNKIIEARAHKKQETDDYDPFYVGYFVGEGGTPNDPTRVADSGMTPFEEIEKGGRYAEKYRMVSICPKCKISGKGNGSIVVRCDRARRRIIHVCEKCGSEIPLYITDTEIYSHTPALIISTIDKWAVLGRKPEAQTILGVIRSKCPVHGYSFIDKCMADKDCNKAVSIPGVYDGPPSLIVQDELHMLGESLGSLASQYETFLRRAAASVSGIDGMSSRGEWKVIASTATIAGYEKHMLSMYLKETNVFPVKGPSALESFYFEQDASNRQRLVVGFVPHNMTHPNAVIKTLQFFHGFVKKYEGSPGKLAEDYPAFFSAISASEERELFWFVRTSLMYGIVKSETYQVLNSIEDQINPYLRSISEGMEIRETADVTGDSSPIENIQLLHKLQEPSKPDNPEFIVATSSISHGVDVTQLNFMVFRGQPRSTAEFIQAMSRVGRTFQGIVFMVYNPNRERDAGHYMLHTEYLGLGNVLIAPPSIDRYSRQAIDKSAGGVILGLSLLGRNDKRLLHAGNFVSELNVPSSRQTLKELFLSSYLPPGSEDLIPNYDRLEDYVANTFDNKVRAAEGAVNRGLGKWTTDVLECMTSLRQTDKEIELIVTEGDLRDELKRLRRAVLGAVE